MVMFVVRLDERNTNSQVYKLCASLVDAKKRGVRVKIILDQNIDFSRRKKEDAWQIEDKNQNALKYFKENGIEVFYDTKNIYTHSKAIVVDEKIVISGSTNWTGSALNKNNEASTLIRSSELVKSFLRSEEHTSELQSHSFISYAVFCLKKKKKRLFPL